MKQQTFQSLLFIASGSSEENSRKQSGSSRTANLHCNYSETLRSIWKRPSVIKIQFRDGTMTPGGGDLTEENRTILIFAWAQTETNFCFLVEIDTGHSVDSVQYT